MQLLVYINASGRNRMGQYRTAIALVESSQISEIARTLEQFENLRFQKDSYGISKELGTPWDPVDSLENYHRSFVNKTF